MAEIKKPELSELEKKRGNELYKYMYLRGTCTKEELCEVLGWTYNTSNDRRIRELISLIGKKVPVISTSDSKGYRIAKSKEDLEAVVHQWREIDKRQTELEERKKPLMKFYEKFKYGEIGD